MLNIRCLIARFAAFYIGATLQKLVTLLKGVAGTLSPPGDIVEVEDSLNGERNVAVIFQESQVPARVGYFGQID